MNSTASVTLNVDLNKTPAEIEADLLAQAKAAAQAFEAEVRKRTYLADLYRKVNADLGLDLPDNRALAHLLLGGHPSAAQPPAPAATRSAPAAAPADGSRRRARITPELREAIIADLRSGHGTAAEIAARHGVSVPSIANIKREAGLTQPRSGGPAGSGASE